MIHLSSIPQIDPSSLELLEAAGFIGADSLAKARVDAVIQELARANQVLRIANSSPTLNQVEAWVLAARELVGVEERANEAAQALATDMPQAQPDLGSAPFAIPLPARLLVEKQLTVGDIPEGIFLGKTSVTIEAKSADPTPAVNYRGSSERSGNVQVAETSAPRLEIDTTRIKSTQEFSNETPEKVFRQSSNDNDRVALIRGPLEKTNRGRNPQSRRYIRGVLHNSPFLMKFGAVITLTLFALLPIAVVSAALLLLSDLLPKHFAWVPAWLLVFPASLPLLGLAYLIWGTNGSCRVCGQKQFVPRVCLKNSKAHKIRGLGYIIPVSLHMILFKWFRCTYCGTPVRLKM